MTESRRYHWQVRRMNLLQFILDGAPVVRSTSSTLLLTFQTTGTTFALARAMMHELHKTHTDMDALVKGARRKPEE